MKVALLGVTGRVGSRLATELLSRAHIVTGIASSSEPSAARAGLTFVQADATVASDLIPILRGHDAVISAIRFATSNPDVLIGAVKEAGVKRLLVVGGAGSLEVAPGKTLQDTAKFPAAFKTEAAGGAHFLETLRRETDLDWTFLSPSADFSPGTRTRKFRLGSDQLLLDSKGVSRVSMEDFAIAMVDELERPSHSRRRFTVGY